MRTGVVSAGELAVCVLVVVMEAPVPSGFKHRPDTEQAEMSGHHLSGAGHLQTPGGAVC